MTEAETTGMMAGMTGATIERTTVARTEMTTMTPETMTSMITSVS